MSEPAKIRVMLVDDSAIVRGLMQRALKDDPMIEIVATAVDGAVAVETLKNIPADIVVLDRRMKVKRVFAEGQEFPLKPTQR